MKNLVCLSNENVSIEEIDIPSISKDEALIRTIVCGLCGSDIVKILDPETKKPVKLGHEVVGLVHEVGRDVDKISKGDIVLVSHHVPCYECVYCRHGNFSMCKHFKETNLYPQGFSEYIRITDEHIRYNTFRVSGKKMVKKAVFTEPAACCLRAVKRLKMKKGDKVLVIGSGTIGLIFISLFKKLYSAEVLAMDIDEKKLDAAKRFGASKLLNPGKGDISSDLKNIYGESLDIVEITFTNRATIDTAFKAVRNGGQIQVFAGPSGPKDIEIDFEELYKRELTLFSSYSASPQELKESIGLILKEELDFSSLITDILPIEDFHYGLKEALDLDSFKILFYFDKDLAREYL